MKKISVDDRIIEIIKEQLKTKKEYNETVHSSEYKYGRPSEFYNEGWLLKLVLKWYEDKKQAIPKTKIDFSKNIQWFTEAQLETPFLRSDKKEGYTNADAVIGNFWIDRKARVRLDKEIHKSNSFIVVEAKTNSSLSLSVSGSEINFNQAARNVACIINLIEKSKTSITDDSVFAFYVFASAQKTKMGKIKKLLNPIQLKETINNRLIETNTSNLNYEIIERYVNDHRFQIEYISWEDIIIDILSKDFEYGVELLEFYKKCLDPSQGMKCYLKTLDRLNIKE